MKKRYLFTAVAVVLLLFLCGTHVYAESNWVSPPGGYGKEPSGNWYLIHYKPPVYNKDFKRNICIIEVKNPDGEIVFHQENDYYSLDERIINSFFLDKDGTYTISAQCGWKNTIAHTESATVEAYPTSPAEGTIDISGAVVTADDWVYNGENATPDVTVTLDGKTLSDWTDYDYDFTPHSPTEVGTVDILVTGTGAYFGEVHGSFRILPIDLNDVASVEVYAGELESTGEALEPSVSVKLDYNTWLREDEDYTVTYKNNINPGTGTVTIEGIGHYSGTISRDFTIGYKSYGFSVGGVSVTAGNAADILGDGKVSYDAATRTLSLKDANVTGSSSVSLGSGAYAKYAGKSYYSIYSGETLKIKLSGENTLSSSLKGGNITITGNGKLSVPGLTGGTGGECVGVECNTLLISPESSLFIESKNSPYSNLGIKVTNKLIVQGEMEVSVPRGAPAKGISGPEEIDVSGKLLVTVKSANTNRSFGISAKKINISGSVTVNSAGTKNDTGINCTDMTISNTGSLTVNAYTSAVNTNTIQLGDKLVLFAGTSPDYAYYHEVDGDALAKEYVSISAGKKPQETGESQDAEDPKDAEDPQGTKESQAGDENPSGSSDGEEVGTPEEKAARKVIDSIKNIPAADQLTLDNKAAIEAAATAYGKLTDSEKALVPAETVKKLQEAQAKITVLKKESADKTSAKNVEKAITSQKNDNDPKGSTFRTLKAKASSTKNTSVTLSWSKVKGAKGYIIYANACGKKNKMVKITTTRKTKYTVSKFKGKALKKGTYYKFVVVAYKTEGGYDKTIATSKTIHACTSGGKITNPKKVTVKAKKATVKVKKTFAIDAKQVSPNSKLKIKSHRALSYESSNPKIAAVTKKGVVKGVKAGKATIYVYAQNGVYATVKITVR